MATFDYDVVIVGSGFGGSESPGATPMQRRQGFAFDQLLS